MLKESGRERINAVYGTKEQCRKDFQDEIARLRNQFQLVSRAKTLRYSFNRRPSVFRIDPILRRFNHLLQRALCHRYLHTSAFYSPWQRTRVDERAKKKISSYFRCVYLTNRRSSSEINRRLDECWKRNIRLSLTMHRQTDRQSLIARRFLTLGIFVDRASDHLTRQSSLDHVMLLVRTRISRMTQNAFAIHPVRIEWEMTA